jgi:PKD repeat protein
VVERPPAYEREPQPHYETLGVSRAATPDEIDRAFRKLMRTDHPDKQTGSEARAAAITWAYAVLSDPVKRKLHDEHIEAFKRIHSDPIFSAPRGRRRGRRPPAAPSAAAAPAAHSAPVPPPPPPPPPIQPPIANFTATAVGLDVWVDASGTICDQQAVPSLVYEWDWGDGSSLEQVQASNSKHTYPRPPEFVLEREYTISLVARNSAGRSAAQQWRVQVRQPPTISRVVHRTSDLTVHIDRVDVVPANATITFDWGDNTPVDRNRTHTYQGAYEYTLTVTATSPTRGSCTFQTYISASPRPPLMDFEIDVVDFTAQIVNIRAFSSGVLPWTYSCSWGDGKTTSSLEHVYENPGTFKVALRAKNAGGATQITKHVTIPLAMPSPSGVGLRGPMAHVTGRSRAPEATRPQAEDEPVEVAPSSATAAPRLGREATSPVTVARRHLWPLALMVCLALIGLAIWLIIGTIDRSKAKAAEREAALNRISHASLGSQCFAVELVASTPTASAACGPQHPSGILAIKITGLPRQLPVGVYAECVIGNDAQPDLGQTNIWSQAKFHSESEAVSVGPGPNGDLTLLAPSDSCLVRSAEPVAAITVSVFDQNGGKSLTVLNTVTVPIDLGAWRCQVPSPRGCDLSG